MGPTDTRGTRQPVRRTRLTPERESELYEAVLQLLREVGYDSLTMDAVAVRTHSSKATLYRQWKGKPELVASALRHGKPMSVTDIDTGTLRGDLLEMARRTDTTQVERDSALLRGLGHAAHENPGLLQALRELLIFPEIAAIDAIFQRAVERGELSADAPARRYVPHMLIGAFVTRPMIEDRPVDADFLTRYVNAVILPALGA